MTDKEIAKPWYKEFWAWFILAPLIATLILSSIMVTTAVRFGDDELTDDYYKKGRMINQSLEKVELARALGLQAELKFDLELGDINLRLSAQDGGYELPESLTLFVDHPIEEKLDLEITLREFAPGNYRADLDSRLANRWYLRLTPNHHNILQQNNGVTGSEVAAIAPDSVAAGEVGQSAHAWRLNGEIDFNGEWTVQLQAP